MEITLNKEQEEGAEKIRKFLESSDRVFRLTGRAGSGKTTMLKYALKDFMNKKTSRWDDTPKVIGIATSHKAKKILKNSIPECTTFASAFGFKTKIVGDKEVFIPEKNLKKLPIGRLNIPLFVHDEVSMYSNAHLDLLLKEHPIFSKIILLGDSAQLPPITEDHTVPPDSDSPCFTLPLPEHCQHNLTDRVRQGEGNPILDLSDICIEEIFGGHDITRVVSKILEPCLDEKGNGYKVMSYEEAAKEYIAKNDFLNNKIITYRNAKAVVPINKQIRKEVIPGAKETIEPGDLIFMTNNFYYDDGGYEFMIENAEDLKIEDVTIEMFEYKHLPFPIECFKGYVENDELGRRRFIITPTKEGTSEYFKALAILEKMAMKKGWKIFYDFKNSFSSFTYSFAINAYRSQGSTYENVYIDLNDILSLNQLTDKRKLQTIYTALTRAQKQVIFFNRNAKI